MLYIYTHQECQQNLQISELWPGRRAARRHYLPENTHATSEVVGRHLDAAIGALMYLSSILSVLKNKNKNKKQRSPEYVINVSPGW